MIRALACALLAALVPQALPDPPQQRPSEPRGPAGAQETSQDAFAFGLANGAPAFPAWSWSFDQWSRLGPSRGLGLARLDAATRAQLKVPEGRGLVATDLDESAPEWRAGLRNDDVLLALDDEPLAEPEDLERLLKKAGEKPATLSLIRKAKPMTIQVQARIRAELGPVESRLPEYWIGASVSAIAPALRTQLDLPADRGLAVTEVAGASPASRAGLAAGRLRGDRPAARTWRAGGKRRKTPLASPPPLV